MTAGPVAPVIPSLTGPVRRGRGAPAGPASLLPLAASPPDRTDVVYGAGRIDASGRVADRAVTSVPGWRGGDRLTLTASSGIVVARRDPGGMVTRPVRPCIVIPAALRHRCGLRAGDRVLLAAAPEAGTLIAYPLAVVDRAIRAHGMLPSVEGGQP